MVLRLQMTVLTQIADYSIDSDRLQITELLCYSFLACLHILAFSPSACEQWLGETTAEDLMNYGGVCFMRSS